VLLREWRQRRNLSQFELALRSAVSAQRMPEAREARDFMCRCDSYERAELRRTLSDGRESE
jgi:hypothetical protein